MRQFTYGFVFVSFVTFACELETPMLRVHCDVNKTIICTDAVQGKGLEETVNGILAEFTFDKWDGDTQQSYYAFVTAQLARNHPELSQTTQEFKKKRGELLKEFPNFLKKFPQQHAQYQDDRSKMLALLGKEETVVFPSFFKLLGWLNSHYNGRHVVYLRTFGQDLPEVMSKIEEKSFFKFYDSGCFEGRILSFPQFANTVASDFFKNSLLSYGIRDDYEYWKSKGFQAEGGKPFPVGLNENEIEIFFDDNADDAVKPIIFPFDSEGKILDTAELLGKGIIVAVNPKEAILDEDYFINKLKARIKGS